MTRLPRARAGDERGFTLVELLIAITVTGLIIGALSGGLIVGFRTSGETATRLAGSADAQFLSIVLPPDIESTGNTTGDVVATPTANSECSGIANVLRLRWTSSDTGTAVTYQAAYAIRGNATKGWSLTRSFCTGAGVAATRTIARNLGSATAATVALSGTRVAMTVTEATIPVNPTAYVFTVSGNRRTP